MQQICGSLESVHDIQCKLGIPEPMRRRDFIATLARLAACWPLTAAARAQSVPVIGFLGSQSADDALLANFFEGLSEFGYVEHQNVIVDYQWARNENQDLPALAARLAQRQVTLIIAAGGSVAAKAATGATTTIPILFISGLNPVRERLVSGLSRPGGNATGIANYNIELIPKRLELLKQMLSRNVTKLAYLMNDDVTGIEDQRLQIKEEQEIAGSLGLSLYFARKENDIEQAFCLMAEQGTEALLVASDPLFIRQRARLVALAAQYSLPAAYRNREFADAGGLMSYGASLPDLWRQIGRYAGRILKGARPEELPVQLPSKFELVINMKTARALGLTVPPLLRAIADEVID
jgi:putative ABC transport system substrate-binding protein